MAHILRHPLAGSHKTTQAGQRLTKSAHNNIYLIGQAKIVGCSSAAIANYTQSMRIIHHDLCAISFGQAHNLRQIGNIATHAEDTVCHDQDSRRLWYFLQLLFQILHIIMSVPQHLAIRKAAAIINAGMIFTVADNIIVSPHYCTDDTQIGLKTG